MQYYVSFNEDGTIFGFYDSNINQIPTDAMPITVEQWQLYSANAQLYKRDGETIREKTQQELDEEAANQPPPVKTPDQIKIEMLTDQLTQQSMNSTAFMEFVLQTLGVE